MDEDTEDAALAQLELEAREYNEILARDVGYEHWLNSLKTQEYEREIFCESNG